MFSEDDLRYCIKKTNKLICFALQNGTCYKIYEMIFEIKYEDHGKMVEVKSITFPGLEKLDSSMRCRVYNGSNKISYSNCIRIYLGFGPDYVYFKDDKITGYVINGINDYKKVMYQKPIFLNDEQLRKIKGEIFQDVMDFITASEEEKEAKKN